MKNSKKRIKCGAIMRFYRVERFLYTHHMKLLSKLIYRLIQLVFNCVIPPSVSIGKNTQIVHGVGIVMHHTAIIGSGCIICQNVTIGLPGVVIGDNVLIGAGAVILGPVNIGSGARIGANTVVNIDIEKGCTAVGSKCRVIRKNGDSDDLK